MQKKDKKIKIKKIESAIESWSGESISKISKSEYLVRRPSKTSLVPKDKSRERKTSSNDFDIKKRATTTTSQPNLFEIDKKGLPSVKKKKIFHFS